RGAAYLDRHADVLAEVVPAQEFSVRRDVAARCARSPQVHAVRLAALAVDADGGVRAQALSTLSLLGAAPQIEVLRPHLRTARLRRLPAALARLTDLDGGVEAIEETLGDGGTAAAGVAEGREPGRDSGRDSGRERLLRRAVFRARVLRPAGSVVAVPPVTAPDEETARELHA